MRLAAVALSLLFLGGALAGLPSTSAWNPGTHEEYNEVLGSRFRVDIDGTSQALGSVPLHNPGSVVVTVQNFCKTSPVTVKGHTVGEVLANHAAEPDNFDPNLLDGIDQCGKLDGTSMSRQWKHAYFLDPIFKNHEVGGLGWGYAPEMVEKFYGLARQEFATYYADPVNRQEHATRGWLYLALATHYVQDMGVPYHVGFEVAGSVAGQSFTEWGQDKEWLDWWVEEGCFSVRAGHPGKASMGGHLRYECGVHNPSYPDSPYLPQPGNVLSRNVDPPQYGEPGDYAIKLAEKSIDKGDSLSNAYFVIDLPLGGFMDDQGKELLDDTTLKLHEWTLEHTLGLIEHMAREFPDLQAGTPAVSGSAVTLPVSNPSSHVVKFLVRLLGTSCKQFTCAPTSVVIGEQSVTLAAFETKTLSFAVSASQAAMALSTVVDAVPVAGEGCEALVTGCIPEPVEILVDSVGVPPPALFLGLADLAVSPSGIHYTPGAPTVVVDVANEGSLAAPAFDVQLYSRSASGSLASVGSANVASGLAAGQAVSVPIAFTGTLNRPVVRVDTAGTVQEIDDTGNNQADLDAVVINDRFQPSGPMSPLGDVWIGPGGDLVLDGVTLSLRTGAQVYVAPGGALHADHAAIRPAAAGGTFYLKSGGLVDIANSTVSGVVGGLRLQAGGSIVDSTLTSLANYPAVMAVRGVVTLERNVVDGAGSGLAVAGGALARSANNLYTGPGGRAVEVAGGQFLSYDDRLQAAKTALLVTSGGVAQMDGALLRPAVGLAPQATVGIEVRTGGGTVVADGVTITDATKGILGAAGRVRLTDSLLDAATNVDASGAFEVRATGLDLGAGPSAFAGTSWMRTEFPLDVSAVSPAPDLAPLAGATLQLRDASGAAVWAGTTGADGRVQVIVTEKTQRASGTTSSLPATLTALYNGPSVSTVLTAPTAAVQLAPPVLKDLAVTDLVVLPSAGQDQAAITVANLESVTVPGVTVRLTRDGATVATATVGALDPEEEALALVALPSGTGTHLLEAMVDPGNAVSETDESNNRKAIEAWIVSANESCAGPKSVAGMLVVKAPARLDLAGCSLSMGDATRPGRVQVMPGATLRLAGQSALSSPSGLQVKSQGTLQVVDSTMDVDSIRTEGGAFEATRSQVEAKGLLLHANNTAVVLRDSVLSAGNITAGVTVSRGTLVAQDTRFEGFLGSSLRLEHLAAADLARLTFRDAGVGVEFYNSTATLRDSVIEPSVSQPFTAMASRPRLLNVTTDVTRGHIGFESTVDVAWYATATVRGSDGQAVAGATVSVVDRAGTMVGQWTTDAAGRTPRLELLERELTDVDGDLRPLLATESFHHDPYTVQSMSRSSVMALPGNAAITLGQTYGTVLTSTLPYATLPPSGQADLPVRVQNTGNGRDLVAFSVTAPAGWTATVTPTSADLSSQALSDVSVAIRAPATNNATAAFDVTATSEDGTTRSVLRLSAKTGPNVVPVPLFSVQPDATYVGDPVTFTDLSGDADGWITARQWSFGDGTPNGQGTLLQHAFPDSGDFTVTLSVTDNAGSVRTLQKPVHVFNRPPILEDPVVAPAAARLGDPVAFRIAYRDIDGHAPQSAKVFVDGTGLAMAKVGGTGGLAAYELQLTNLTAGEHRYRFQATDARGATTTYPANFDLRGPRVDSPPVLSLLSATPASGTGSTLFTFRATYRDADDDAPASIRLSVGGTTLDMARSPGSQTYAQGVEYVASTTLGQTGTLPFTVQASDGLATATATATGPTVTSLGGLSGPVLAPPGGAPGTVFDFKVTYKDAGGVAPSSVTLVLDGQARPMTGAGTGYAAGVVYSAQAAGLAAGTHAYHFEAQKGATTLRLPASGTFTGPVVNALPSAQFTVQPTGTIATAFRADGTASGDAETPANQLETRVDWGDGNQTPWSRSRVHEHQFGAPGSYAVAFHVRDGQGAVAALTRPVEVASTAPTASFSVSPQAGAVEDGSGSGTLFLFRPGASGDIEDAWDTLRGRWDWEGDGAWDTDWLAVTSQVGHKYTTARTHTPILQVQDTTGLTGTATLHVKANGLRQLAMSVPASDILDFQAERHDYRLTVPANLVNLDVTMAFPAVAGVDYDLYVRQGTAPADPSNCRGTCWSSTSLGTGQAEEVCLRLPAAGTYTVTVLAKDQVPGKGQQYTLTARPDVKTANVVVNCMVLG